LPVVCLSIRARHGHGQMGELRGGLGDGESAAVKSW
jgi:hypothetical protein